MSQPTAPVNGKHLTDLVPTIDFYDSKKHRRGCDPVAPSRVHWLVAGGSGLFMLATGVGICIYLAVQLASGSRANTPSQPQPQPVQIQGLPDIHLAEKIVTTRERELLAVLSAKGTDPDDVVKASVELGLLYVKDRRFARRSGPLRAVARQSR